MKSPRLYLGGRQCVLGTDDDQQAPAYVGLIVVEYRGRPMLCVRDGLTVGAFSQVQDPYL
jgi:hypothetical protein